VDYVDRPELTGPLLAHLLGADDRPSFWCGLIAVHGLGGIHGRVTRRPFPPIIVIAFDCSFAFNTRTPFGVLLIQGDFFND
jgi:hypothetical protein